MVKIDKDGTQGGIDTPNYPQLKLENKARLEGVISRVSPVWEAPAFGDDDKMIDKLTVFVRVTYDELQEELGLSDDQIDAIDELYDAYNDEVEAFNEKVEDRDGFDEREKVDDGVVVLKYYCTANITRGEQRSHHSNLYKTLEELELVDADEEEDRRFEFLDRDGDIVTPFDDADSDGEIKDAMHDYLSQNLVGKSVEIEVKNVNIENDKDEYSVIGEFIKELDG